MEKIHLASLFAILFTVIPAGSTTGILVVDANMTLAEDHFGEIRIEADGVTLDCAGHEVAGARQFGGIFIRDRADITVRNCRVTGFERGFLVDRSSNVLLERNYATENQWGFWITASDGVQIIGNTAENNHDVGFYLGTVSRSLLSDNRSASNGGNGYGLLDSDANVLLGNEAEDNDFAGFFIDTSHQNVMERNVALGNNTGFDIVRSVSNTLVENEALENAGLGFRVAGSDEVYLADNIALNNQEDSFHIEGLTSIFEAPSDSLVGGVGSSQRFGSSVGETESVSSAPPGQGLSALRPEYLWLLLVPAAILVLLFFTRNGRAWASVQAWTGALGLTKRWRNQGQSSRELVGPEGGGDDRESAPFLSPSTSEVEDALRHIHNLAFLGTHVISSMRLIHSRVPVDEPMTHVDLGRITQQVIREGVNKFKPAEERPPRGSPPEWHQYLILHESYFKGRLNREVMADLHIGEGTFHRRRREAIKALARLLNEWDEAEANGSVG